MNWKKVAIAAAVVVVATAAYVLLQEPVVVAWLKITSYKGAPRWAWLALVGLFVGDYCLLRVKNPRARAVAEFLPNVFAWLFSQFPQVQGAGMWIAKTLGTPPPTAPAPKSDDAGPIKLDGSALLLLLVPALLAIGCATSTTKPGATFAQKIHDDQVALEKIRADVKAQCGAQLAVASASVGPLISDGLAIATAPTDVLNDIAEAARALPLLKEDGEALWCVLKVLSADLKQINPHAARQAERLLAELAALELVPTLAILDLPPLCTIRPDQDVGACRPSTLECGDNGYGCAPDDWERVARQAAEVLLELAEPAQ